MSFFDAGLYISLFFCLAGLAWRVARWFRHKPAARLRPQSRVQPALIKKFTAALIKDVVLLARTARRSPYRWAAHSLIFAGFMYLLLFHAMSGLVASSLVDNYWPTLDPWQFLRNLAGLMVLTGIVMAVLRRLSNPRLRRLSGLQDWLLLILLAGIMLSGFILEASKMVSPAVFDRMAQEYLGSDDPGEVKALKAHWAKEYGVAFDHPLPGDAKTLQWGADISADSCAECHSPAKTAFVSFAMAKGMGSAAHALNRMDAEQIFFYLHVALCFLGLACLPLAKLIHPLTTPLNLLIRRLGKTGQAAGPFASPALQGLAMDACTRCAECSLHCSVAPAHAVLGNADILPSEKLASLIKYRAGVLAGRHLDAFTQGSRICTECGRCTDICPAGIDLQSLWQGSKKELGDPSRQILSLNLAQRVEKLHSPQPLDPEMGQGLALRTGTFTACLQCTTCTSVCPVAALSPAPARDLDCSPQQIMNLLRMGMVNQAMASGMTWRCTTCYKCSEACPQNIPVADVLSELRNMALNGLNLPKREMRG